MRLRQVALVAQKLAPTVDEIGAVLGIDVAYNDPGVAVFGLENAVFAVGETFLEVVSPVRPDTTAGRLLERRGGDGGYMVILQVDDLARERARLDRLGVRVVWEADLGDAATIHLHPKDLGGAIVSLDRMDPPESWKWAGPDWRARIRRDGATRITEVEVQSDDPAATSGRWAEVLARPAQRAGHAHRIDLDDGRIRFVRSSDGRGDGVSAVAVAAADRTAILARARERGLAAEDGSLRLCGTIFRID